MLASLARLSSRQRGPSGLTESEEALLLLRTFETSSQGWFWAVDAEGRLTYISESIAALLNTSAAALLGKRLGELFAHVGAHETGGRTLPFLLTKRAPFQHVAVRASATKLERYWALSGSPQFDRGGSFDGFRGSAVDITEQRQSSAHASLLAEYDALTGLPNRRRMAEVLEQQLVSSAHSGRPSVVMLVDLDRFKHVNDTLGHPAGDELLKQVADRLTRIVGDREKVCRLGGDEFQVCIADCGDQAAIGELASRVILGLSQPYNVAGSRCVIGASIGVAFAPADGTTRVDLIRNADLALYASKADGRGRYKFFSRDLLAAAEEKRFLEEDLRDALARDELSLAYQPVVNAQTNQITGVEALLRWEHPDKGLISPAIFVPIAEEAGIIGALGDWALRKACEDAVTWPGEIRVAVNVSPMQFKDRSLPATVLSALTSSGLAAERLELEITESVFLGDTPAADAMFEALKAIGVRLALDDFGTGYSSLGYLRSAPFDKIKIDQTFVREATLPGSRNAAIIAAIVALAEALDMETTAEGIEFMDQLALIRSLRVSHVQGWVYSKALASAQLIDRLGQGQWLFEPSGPAKQRSSRQSVFRKVGVICGSRYQTGIIRNLSESGALIDGLNQVQSSTEAIVDFGDGQLTRAKAVRMRGTQVAFQFAHDLIDDGSGALCTPQRISSYLLATVSMPSPGDPDQDLSLDGAPLLVEQLADRLGLDTPSIQVVAAPVQSLHWSSEAEPKSLTYHDLAAEYLKSLSGDEGARDLAELLLGDHLIPEFGSRRLTETNVSALKKLIEAAPMDHLTREQLYKLLARMWALAIDMKLVPLQDEAAAGAPTLGRHDQGFALLPIEQARELLLAARSSPNRQLKFIMSLLMLTGARTREILNVRCADLDLASGVWRVQVAAPGTARELSLNEAAVELVRSIPRLQNCIYLLPNPNTRRPYRTLTQSWEVVKAKAALKHLELDDLRYCDFDVREWQSQLGHFLKQDSDEGLRLEA